MFLQPCYPYCPQALQKYKKRANKQNKNTFSVILSFFKQQSYNYKNMLKISEHMKKMWISDAEC